MTGMPTSTRHQVGDRVVASVTAQGLQAGYDYVVVAVHVEHYPFGGFTTYTVRDWDGVRRDVQNGHLILQPA